MLVPIPEDRDTKFWKRHVDVRDIENVKKQITDKREQHLEKYEKPVTPAYIPLAFRRTGKLA